MQLWALVVFFSLTFLKDDFNILERYKAKGGVFNVDILCYYKRKQTPYFCPFWARGLFLFLVGLYFRVGYLFRL